MPNFGLVDLLVKKGGHLIGYGVFALTILRGLQDPSRKGIALAFLLTALYAISDEIHQAFVPGRGSTWIDVVIDSTGAVLALYAWGKYKFIQMYTVHKPEVVEGEIPDKIQLG